MLVGALILGAAGSLGGVVLGSLLAIVAAGWLHAAGSVTIDGPAIGPAVLATGSSPGWP